jgi:hypothetical protein
MLIKTDFVLITFIISKTENQKLTMQLNSQTWLNK